MFSYEDILWPLVSCVVLVLIHAYFGIQVLKRQVIFVDLALAQIASLGALVGIILGLSIEDNPILLKFCSALFTVFGALGFTVSKRLSHKVPHEALIGIFYAFSLSLIIILSSNLPHGAEEIKQMFSGSILWVTPIEIFWSLVLYLLIGFFHYCFRDNFSNYEKKNLWDFLFYVSLGLVVTSSVSIAGVLLVFSYLVIPSCIGMILSKKFSFRFIFSVIFGILASIAGIFMSFIFDYPTGPSIIIILCLFLFLVILIKRD